MKTIYIVKSFGPQNGYLNLRAFNNMEDAEVFYDKIQEQIHVYGDADEFVEIEDITLE